MSASAPEESDAALVSKSRRIRPARDAELIRDMLRGMCLDGMCYELAIALHREAGLPMVGLWSPTASGDDGVPGTWRHAAVRWNGGFIDARGPIGEDHLGCGFGEPQPWDIRDIGEADLLAVRPIAEMRMGTLVKLAQAAWPELPWRPSSFQGRMDAFLADLEALSRSHQIWIRAPYPAGRPHLTEGDGDETGYAADVTDDGLGVVFDRSFKPG